jgi:hypothetical protein
MEMLADRAFRQIDAMPCLQNRADLRGGACRQLQSQLAGFLQQVRVAAHRAKIGTRRRAQSVETLLAVRANPAIERDARIGPLAAIWMFVGLRGQFAHQLSTFSWTEPWVRRGGDHRITEEGDRFTRISGHGSASGRTQGMRVIQTAPLRGG